MKKRGIIFIAFWTFLIIYFVVSSINVKEILMVDLKSYNINEIKSYAKENNLTLEIKKEYNYDIKKDDIINQSINPSKAIKKGDKLIVTISLGAIPLSLYEDNKVNELGRVPIMMYHRIENITGPTSYTGGNVDKDGYNRTKEAFINDLEMYYQKGYRMIKLNDYINGNIDVPLGKSPIILTFDDGNKDNINILGTTDSGELMIDPNSAVGILETFKQKYSDYHVTATFFLNKQLFNQPTYNEKIIKWLISHGYDIGNHTSNHADLGSSAKEKVQSEIAYMYQEFDRIIPNQYLHVIALPYGSPYNKSHLNFPYIIEGANNGYNYKTESTLRVGWDPEYSPFDVDFDKEYLKRVRAWDNNGTNYDIEMTFKLLDKNRYISDGDKTTIVVNNDTHLNRNIKDKRVILY